MADNDPGSPTPPSPNPALPKIGAVIDEDVVPPPTATPPPATGDLSDFALDKTRKQLAYLLLYVLIGIVAVIMLMSVIYSVRCWSDNATCGQATTALGILTGAASPIFTAMIGLVGSVVGFYFGSKQTG